MIYLDYSATTPIHPEVLDAMLPYLAGEYGNPSSKYYHQAENARKAVEQARVQVAGLIGAEPEEIIFTSGATESTNMILKGVSDYRKLYEKRGNHLITSQAEHKATLNTCKYLNGEIYSNKDATFSFSGSVQKVDRGYEVTFLGVNRYGQVEPESLAKAIKPATTLVSLIWGNNETGAMNDVAALAKICYSKGVLFHTDATQVLGKLDISVKEVGADFLSLSAHKVCGPKGIGAAFVKSDDYGLPPFSALLHGGEQENGLRGSTLAVHDIVGFGKAAELALVEREKSKEFYARLDMNVLKMIRTYPQLRLVGDPVHKLPGVYSIIVDRKEFNNELFLKRISCEFALSSGSACTAGQPSHVLQAMGLGDFTGKVVRISVGPGTPGNPADDIAALLKRLADA